MSRNPFDGVVDKMDFSQIEAQCASVREVTREKALGDCMKVAFPERPGINVATVYASEKWGVPPENVTPAMRRVAKNELFCRLYGGSGLAKR